MVEKEEHKKILLKISLLPMSLMLVTDVIECINYNVNKKIRRYSIWYFYGIIFCLSYFLYAIPELAGVFSKEAEKERMKNK
jgi:hypothetical protein